MKIAEFPKPGDIGLTRSKHFLGRAIRKFQGWQQEGVSEVNHAFLSIGDEGEIIEALNRVEINNITDYLSTGEAVYLVRIRPAHLPEYLLKDSACYAISKYAGQGYGYGKIALQVLDTIFSTNRFTSSSFTEHPYCSELVAKALMRNAGFLFRNSMKSRYGRKLYLDPKSVTPANIYNDALARPEVFEIYQYVPSPINPDIFELIQVNIPPMNRGTTD